MKPISIGILLFDEVEVLDFAGPFEVFSLARHADGEKAFRVHTVAQEKRLIHARGGLCVLPEHDFATIPPLDALIVPGGWGAEEVELHNPAVLRFVNTIHNQPDTTVASVCTGAFILAEAGLLDGRAATTHWMDLDRLAREYSQVTVRRGIKFVDEGCVLTSGGISAGIHLALHLVSRWAGRDAAVETARRMEYDIAL